MTRQELFQHFDKSASRLRWYCFCEVPDTHAEDVFQEVIVTAIRLSETASFENYRAFNAWLYKIARFAVLKFFDDYRKHKHVEALTDDAIDSASDRYIENFENREFVAIMLATISPYEQNVVKLKYYEERTYGEIGSILGKSEKAIGATCRRALQKLNKKFSKYQKYLLLFVSFFGLYV